MKKLFAVMMVLCMLMNCACASAATFDDLESILRGGSGSGEQADPRIVYDMPQLKLSMLLPESYVVLNEAAPEESFAALGMEKAAMMETLLANSTYMVIFPGDFSHEIDVVMTANDLKSFDGLTDSLLQQSADLLDDMFADMGCTVEKHDIYTVNDIRYIRTWYNVPSGDSTAYVMQYYTVESNMGLVYRLFSYTGAPIAQSMQDDLLKMVEGISYN